MWEESGKEISASTQEQGIHGVVTTTQNRRLRVSRPSQQLIALLIA